MRSLLFALAIVLLVLLAGKCFGQSVLVSSFQPKQRTINPPANFTAQPLCMGQFYWYAGDYQFAYAWVGADGKYCGLSPSVQVHLNYNGGNFFIRIPGNAGSKAIGFVPFFKPLNSPQVNWQNLWFPCAPSNGINQWFHFAPGSRREGGQLLIVYPYNPSTGSAPQHWDYVVPTTNKPTFPRGGIGWDGSLLTIPATAPEITVAGQIAPGDWYVASSYVCGNGVETGLSPPQKVTLGSTQHFIQLSRSDSLQQGVKSFRVYMGSSATDLHLQGTYQRNWLNFYLSNYNPNGLPPMSKGATWLSNPLAEALDSNAMEVIVDIPLKIDCAPVIPYRADLSQRVIRGTAYQQITVPADGECLTMQASYTYLENIQFAGGNEGLNFCDNTGGCCFLDHYKKVNIRPASGYGIIADDAGTPGNGGHAASEQFFEDCYIQREMLIGDNQQVDFDFKTFRQDVLTQGHKYPLETAALHAKGNKFLTFDYWGVDASAQTLINLHNEAGPCTISVNRLYVDLPIPMLVAKGQNEPGTISFSNGTANASGLFGLSPNNSPLTIKLDNFIHQRPRLICSPQGVSKVLALDPVEAQSVQVKVAGQ